MTRVSAVGIMTLACALSATSPTFAQDSLAVRLEPGQWRLLIKNSPEGQPTTEKTVDHCYTAAELADPLKTFVHFPQQDPNCTMKHTVAGNTLSVSLVCKPPAAPSRTPGAAIVRAER